MTGVRDGAIWLDEQSGASDDAKLDAAITLQDATDGMPPIHLPARWLSFNKPARPVVSGRKIVYPGKVGPQNLEQGAKLVPCKIKLGSAITNNGNSWWVGTGNAFSVHFGGFAIQGANSNQQFIQFTGGSLYSAEFSSLGFNLLRSVYGSPEAALLSTQVVWSGHHTILNSFTQCVNIGGSDCSLWESGYCNLGVSASTAQTGNGGYQVRLALSKSNVGMLYITGLNGWNSLLVDGDSSNGCNFNGGVYEGYKPGTPTPGAAVHITGGAGTFHGSSFGYACGSGGDGVVVVDKGNWNFTGCEVHRGNMPETQPTLMVKGGEVNVSGWVRAQNESWSGRPRVSGAGKCSVNDGSLTRV